LDFNWTKYTGYSAENHNCRLIISCYYARQSENLFGHIASIVRHDLQFKYENITNIPKQISYNYIHSSVLFGIIDDILHDLNVRDEIKRLSQRYADRLKEHATNLMKNIKITQI